MLYIPDAIARNPTSCSPVTLSPDIIYERGDITVSSRESRKDHFQRFEFAELVAKVNWQIPGGGGVDPLTECWQ